MADMNMTKTVHTPHGHGLDTARRGAARQASARARVARPSPFTNFTSGPPLVHPFKLVKIFIGFQCGIESLAFILWTF
jgi:hypothetical protein